ncbi:MAG TPA: SDR family oxidoreductase [Alphaproteobacteria bacterium]|jgi:NAD(P)-dependent dehydrogenase (short-subunit alcohol dehydrogenase family)|nr:SDR family oxidoreductase [Alphaproteobacteria bacterium]
MTEAVLQGKTAIVSGVGAGLGLAIVRALAGAGADLALGDISDVALSEAEAVVASQNARCYARRTDIREPNACAALVAVAERTFGGVDILVNDAFRAESPGTFENADLDEWRAVADVNLWGSLNMIRAALPALKRSPAAAIVNINSHGSEALDPEFGGYTSSKAALAHLTRHLAREFGAHGIRVNGVHPGPMDALPRRRFLAAQAEAQGVSPESLDAPARERAALGRLATADEAAQAVLFLASPLASGITGQALFVDAGAWLH